jgi:DNA-binding NarL/FixJ family response regulator
MRESQSGPSSKASDEVAVEKRIILADHQTIFRTGVVRVLSLEMELDMVAQCSDVSQLRSAITANRGATVIFASGLTADKHGLMDLVEETGCRAMVVLEHGAVLDDVLASRMHGIVMRSVTGPQLVDAVRRVAAGERVVHRANLTSMPAPDKVGARVLERLTPKDVQIIALVAAGFKNKEIALKLSTKEQVVKNYLRSIYDKTGVSDRLELALFTIHHQALAMAAEKARTALAVQSA